MAATLTTQLDVVTAIVSEKLEAEPDIDQTLPAARRDFLGQLANIYFQYFQREPRFSVKAGRADGPFARFVEITLEEFPVPGGCSMSQANLIGVRIIAAVEGVISVDFPAAKRPAGLHTNTETWT